MGFLQRFFNYKVVIERADGCGEPSLPVGEILTWRVKNKSVQTDRNADLTNIIGLMVIFKFYDVR